MRLAVLKQAINRNLNDFGYKGDFGAEVETLLRGEEVSGIIGMFAQKMLDEAEASEIAEARGELLNRES